MQPETAIENITESQRAIRALAVSETRYRRLFEAAKDGILILDADTRRITDANPFIAQLLGYTREEMIGKEMFEIGLIKDDEASRAAFRELQRDHFIRYDDLPLESKDGKPCEVEVVANLYEEDGRPVIQCNIRDISDRVRFERQALEQTTSLADLNRRKDEFLAMLSHELRNPLAPILNAVHLLRHQGEESPLQRQAQTIIERQVGQLARIVDDLLEVSRVTTGRIKLHLERMDLRAIVENAVDSVRPLIDHDKNELSVSLPPEPVWLHADAARLQQVIVNLLNNAAKYTDRGNIWLSLEQQGDDAVLRVRDTGVGIAPELLPRIFDLFTQADRSLDRSQGGLGIGLTVVQRLVEMHRGTAEASSAGLGSGSEFIVRLPVLLSNPMEHESLATETAASGDRLRVLVVDDNVDSADITALLLRELGHETLVAYSSTTALAAADAYLPNVVLLDIGLPEMDGYEVARRLRQHAVLRNIWLVAITGYGQQSDRQRSKRAGFDHHLIKPVAPAKLDTLLTLLATQDRLAQ